jgi:1-deoxy-D-xylulose-5-phosphate synthase
MEDHVLDGGVGSAVLEALRGSGSGAALERIGWPDTFVEHGTSVDLLRAAHGLAPDDIYRRILARWGQVSASPAVA